MQTLRAKTTSALLTGAILWCLLAFLPQPLSAQDDDYLEEVVITFQVRRLISTDMFVQYDGETIYLPVSTIFDLLGLNIKTDMRQKVLSGYVIEKSNSFRFDLNDATVRFDGKTHRLPPEDYFLGTTDLFLRVDKFEKYFGLPMIFQFSALRVVLPLDESFPAYQRLQRSLEHKRLRRERDRLGDVKNLPYRRAMLGGAVLDWNLSATPYGTGAQYFSTSLGAMIGGGDLSLSATGNSETGIRSDQLSWRWHYFVDTASIVTQVEVGDLFTGLTGGPLSRQLRGAVVTNRPQTQREYFRTITIDGYLGEGWEVELYVDQKLTDFAHTNQSGRYEFYLDVYYGASVVELKMYGPNGEIRTEERYLRVPYNLIPQGKIEYSVAAGEASADTLGDWYSQVSAFYGLRKNISFGLMGDIPVSSDAAEPFAWAAEGTWQAAGNFTLGGSFSPGYVGGLDFNYNQPGLLNIDGSVSHFFENGLRNRLNRQQSAVMAVSAPLRIKQRRLNLRYYLAWDRFQTNDQITMHYGFNTGFNRVHFYYLGKYRVTKYKQRSIKQIISEVFGSVYVTRWLRPQFRVAYDHTENQLDRISLYLSRRVLSNGQISASIERDIQTKTTVFRVTFNLFTNFAEFTTRGAYSNGRTTVNQVQRGSIRYDQEANDLLFERHYGVGRSTAVVRPFVDDNYNGQLDPAERPVPGLRALVRGGRERRDNTKKIYYYDGLNPYDEHLVRIDPISLDNPLLKPIYDGYRVPLNPNMVTTINVPLVITGEVEGMVKRQTRDASTGQGGIKVEFYHQSKESVTEVTTFSNGEFFYLGLIPGRYRAYVSPAQLERLGYRSVPEYIEFEMKGVEGGAVVSDLDFELIPIQPQEPAQ